MTLLAENLDFLFVKQIIYKGAQAFRFMKHAYPKRLILILGESFPLITCGLITAL